MADRLRISLLAFCFLAWRAEAASDNARECVGSLTVALPSDAEIATVPVKKLISQLKGRPAGTAFQFHDGEEAGWSSLRYLGEILVTESLTPAEVEEVKALFIKNRRDYPAVANKAGHKVDIADVFPPTKDAMAWKINNTARLLLEKDRHVVSMTLPQELALSYAHHTKLRQPFSIPDDAALCLPYVALPMTAIKERNIFITYRLVSHPDVTVMVGDSNPVKYDDPVREANAGSPAVMANFWAQYGMGKRIDYLLKPAAIAIDGRTGLESFVKITRDGGGDDYGYFATVRGQYGFSPEQPTIQIYVLRNAARATQKGIPAIVESDMLQLARTIAGSIRRRAAEDAHSSSMRSD